MTDEDLMSISITDAISSSVKNLEFKILASQMESSVEINKNISELSSGIEKIFLILENQKSNYSRDIQQVENGISELKKNIEELENKTNRLEIISIVAVVIAVLAGGLKVVEIIKFVSPALGSII